MFAFWPDGVDGPKISVILTGLVVGFGLRLGEYEGETLGFVVGGSVQSTPAKQVSPSGQSSFPPGHFTALLHPDVASQ